jgi:hypothetical protein
MELPEKIYHYTKIEKAISILSNMHFNLSPLNDTNDPRENKDFLFGFRYNENTRIPDSLKDCNEFSKLLRENCYTICFSANSRYMFGYGLSSQWALYGGDHEGVCLELDTEKFIEENRDIINKDYFRKINYDGLETIKNNKWKTIDFIKMEKVGQEEYIEKFKHDNIDYLYFTKSEEWQHENEVRLISFNKDKICCRINNSLTKIYLGLKFKEEWYKKALEKLCPNIEIINLDYLEGIMKPRDI